MMSVSKAKKAASATEYFSDHLNPDGEAVRSEAEDYYRGEGDPGTWYGTGAAELGLMGKEVTNHDFASLATGCRPDGESLLTGRQRQTPPEHRRAGWDCTFSPPKSVSIAWALGSEEQRAAIQAAHDRAVEAAIKKLEQEAIFSGRGKGGRNLESSKMVAAAFRHATSRELDPQLHTHVFAFNLAQRPDGSWGGIQSKEILRRKKEIGAYYSVAMAAELRKLGFRVERDRQEFRLAGMSKEAEKRFSKRRGQIVERMKQKGVSSAKAAAVNAIETRSAKRRVSREELDRRWRTEARELGLDEQSVTPEALAAAAVREREAAAQAAAERGEEYTEPAREMPNLEALLRDAFDRASTLTGPQLAAVVYQHAQCVLTPAEAEDYLQDLLESKHIIRLKFGGEVRYTSREMYLLEKGIADDVVARQDEHHATSEAALGVALASRPTISEEQLSALRHITGREGVAAVQGAAGTGKSYMLGAAREAWQHDGRTVLGCAPSGKAAEELESGSGIPCSTVHRLLHDLDNGKIELSRNHVIVMDEAGMAGSRLMRRLLDAAGEAGAKVVMCGDVRQLQPIDAGGAFRLVQQRIGAAHINDVRRQRYEWHRQAVIDLAEGRAAKAIQAFEERGLLHVIRGQEELKQQLLDRWLGRRNPEKPGETIMIAARRMDVRELNRLAQERLAAEGELDFSHAVTVDGVQYMPGDRLLFLQNDQKLGVKNGTLAALEKIEQDGETLKFTARTDGGRQVQWTIGDQPGEYDSFGLGYAITAHKSQGVTVDHALVMLDESMSDLHWSYVAASRSRYETELFADQWSWPEIQQLMGQENLKTTSQDYELDDELEL